MNAVNFTQADRDRVQAEARAAGYQEGVMLERARAVGILTCPEAEGRDEMARYLATQPGLSVEQARGILAKVPPHVAKLDAHNPFAAAMAQLGNPDVCGIEGPSHLDAVRDGAGADAVAQRIAGNVKTGGGKR